MSAEPENTGTCASPDMGPQTTDAKREKIGEMREAEVAFKGENLEHIGKYLKELCDSDPNFQIEKEPKRRTEKRSFDDDDEEFLGEPESEDQEFDDDFMPPLDGADNEGQREQLECMNEDPFEADRPESKWRVKQASFCLPLPAYCLPANTFVDKDGFIGCKSCEGGKVSSAGFCVDTCPTGTTKSTDNTKCKNCPDGCDTCDNAGVCSVCNTLKGWVQAGPICSKDHCNLPENKGDKFNGSICVPCTADCSDCDNLGKCRGCGNMKVLVIPNVGDPTCEAQCPGDHYEEEIISRKPLLTEEIEDDDSKPMLDYKSVCVKCDTSCATCSGPRPDDCLTCTAGPEFIFDREYLKFGQRELIQYGELAEKFEEGENA